MVIAYACATFTVPNLRRTDFGLYSLTTVSLSRFLLNLRGVAYKSDMMSATERSTSRSHMSSLHFSRFVGSLGNAVGDDVLEWNEEDTDANVLNTDSANITSSIPAADIELECIS